MADLTQPTAFSNGSTDVISTIKVGSGIHDRIILTYLLRFGEDEQSATAVDAMKVGAIAIENARPTLDTGVVQEQFGQVED